MRAQLLLSAAALLAGVSHLTFGDEQIVPKRPAPADQQAVEKIGTNSTRSLDSELPDDAELPDDSELPDKAGAKATPDSKKKNSAVPPVAESVSPDEAAIRLVAEAFRKAYEAGDAKSVAAIFTPDAEYVDSTGVAFAGREAIEETLSEFFEENPNCRLEIAIDSIRIVSPGVAVEDGHTSVTLEEESTPRDCRYTTVYVKVDDQWLAASVRDHAPRDLRQHRVQLQQLDWLIGDWVDEGDDAIVNFSCEAVDNGNFLVRKFNIVIAGQEALAGTQRIGWDPLTGKLRTWIFDSEGAYGEGFWFRDGESNNWVLKVTGVSADGEAASSTSVYTAVNAHTMTWQSVDREIGGMEQPDSEIFTIVRCAPSPLPIIAEDDNAQR